jgi:hypothetical protein
MEKSPEEISLNVQLDKIARALEQLIDNETQTVVVILQNKKDVFCLHLTNDAEDAKRAVLLVIKAMIPEIFKTENT